MHDFTRYVNPHLGELLEQLGMDKTFVRGEGHYLFDAAGNRYLEFMAAYGALPFGHNPAQIWQALFAVQAGGEPAFVQPSALTAAGELARRLVELAPPGLSTVTFTNSGAETVEAALKMARSATGRPGILSCQNSFHGKTLGALSATGREHYQLPFGAPVAGFQTIPYDDVPALERELAAQPDFWAAFIVEPIQGEGGIVVPRAGYLSRAGELCRKYGVLFILDEIQTGLGRCGRLFACEEDGAAPDMLLLAKALGGGIYPIGACLATPAAYTRDFGERHSSTFAANAPGCRIGLTVLSLLTRDDGALLGQVRENGRFLLDGVRDLRRRFPRVLTDARGRGLMLGLEFQMSRSDFPDCLLSVLAEQENLTPLVSSYLLNEEGLRVAPTLNGNKVIRLEPPLTITREECRTALDSLGRALAQLDAGNTLAILRPVLGHAVPAADRAPRAAVSTWNRYQPSADPQEGRFAFLVHPLDLYNYHQFDPSLKALPPASLEKLADLGSRVLDPFVAGRTTVVSQAGYRAFGEFIALPFTARQMVELEPEVINKELEKALALALERGARLVGLGAYTSVVSRGGTLLKGKFLPITTGNSYTVVSGAEAVKLAAGRFAMNLGAESAAVIGATGSIGRTLAILMAEEMQQIILVGNARHPQASARRLRHVGADICRHLARQIHQGWTPAPGTLGSRVREMSLPGPDAPPQDWLPVAAALEEEGLLTITCDPAQALPRARVVVTATSSVEDLVNPRWVAGGAIICDISKPSNVRPSLRQIRPDVLIIDGGVVAVPGRPSLGWNFGFEEGLAYACMAETMMLALEHHYTDMSLGTDLSLDNLVYLRKLAAKHGFTLAELRSFDLPLSEEEWRRVAAARSRPEAWRQYGSAR